MKQLLRILSGPQAGAEALLRPGEYILGRADDCDFILDDANAADHHATLFVTGTAVEVGPLDGPVFLQGRPVEGERAAVANFQVLTIGGTHFCFGPSEGTWPRIEMPSPGESEGEKAAGESDKSDKVPGPAGKGDASAAAKRKAAAAKREVKAVGGPSKSRRVLWVAILLLLAVAGVWGMWTLANSFNAPLDESTVRVSEAVERLQARGIRCWDARDGKGGGRVDPRRGLAVSFQPEQGVIVRGIVIDDATRRRVSEALEDGLAPAKMEVKTLGEIVAVARALLTAEKRRLRADPEGWNGIRVKGFVRDDAVREAVSGRMETVVPDGVELRWSLVEWEQLRPVAEAALVRRKLSGLGLEPKETHIEVSGGLTEKDRLAWASFRKALDDAFSVPIPLDDPEILKEPDPPVVPVKPVTPEITAHEVKKPPVEQEKPVEPVKPVKPDDLPKAEVVDAGPAPLPKLSVKAVVKTEMGSPRRFQDGDAKWFQEGAILDCGFAVREIFAEGVVLTRGDEIVILTIGEK